jgi:dipeptidyl-peptidase-4
MPRTLPIHRILASFAALTSIPLAAVQQPAPAAPAPAPAATSPAGPRELTVDEVFALPAKLRGEVEEPIAWIDVGSYLAFGKLPPAADAKEGSPERRGFCRVDAASGAKTVFFDPDAFAAKLAAMPGFSRDEGKRVAADADQFRWSLDHRAAVLNLARDLFFFDVQSGDLRRLTHGPGEEVGEELSPDRRLLAYVRDHNLHVVDTGGGPERPLTTAGNTELLFGRLDWVYQEELYGRGNFKGYWWSPDSTRLAFLRLDESPVREFTLVSDTPTQPNVEVTHYPKAGAPNPKVAAAVIDVRGGEPTYFDLSRYGTDELLVSRVQWHPGGDEVYLQVQDRVQSWLDLLAGDPRTGKVRVVLREASDCWVEVDAQPYWLDGGRSFLWLSERDGFKHMYHYGRDGKLIKRLSEGPFEVDEIVGIDEKARVVYYLTDRADVKGQQLWRIGLDGQGDAQVTKERGTHSVKASPDFALIIDSESNAELGLRLQVKRMDDELVRSIASTDMAQLAEFGLSPVEFHQVKARDGVMLEGMLIKPRGFEPGKRYPTLCFTYAGPHAQQVRDRWGGRNYLWHQMMAQKGYLVWVCDNRSASGKGRASAKACHLRLGQVELQDLEDAVQHAIQQGWTDPARVGIWGWSYGGYQTCYCLTHSKVWKLGIAVNPVTDWAFYDSIYTERYMGLPQVNEEGYRKASVIKAAADLHGKLLLVHATMDDNVHIQNSLALVHALQIAGKQFQFMPYPRVRHDIGSQKQQMHLFQMMADFVAANL